MCPSLVTSCGSIKLCTMTGSNANSWNVCHRSDLKNAVMTYNFVHIVALTSASYISGRKIRRQSAADQIAYGMLVLMGSSSSLSFIKRRPMTHQEHCEVCEVITATAGLTGRNTQGFTTSAVPTTLSTWHTHNIWLNKQHLIKAAYQETHDFLHLGGI